MTTEELFQVYVKEREYQTKIFGDFRNNKSLNLASFLIFLESYLKKTISCYSDKWADTYPDWLTWCKEFDNHGTAPMLSYENLIKVFALAGAALETFAEIDSEFWRVEGVKKKWLNGKEIANE